MKPILILMAGVLAYLSASGADLATNVAPLTAVAKPATAPEAAARQQLQDIAKRRAEAVAKIPGMPQLDAQAADLTARLRAVAEARRALLASNPQVVAALDAEAAQVRATVQRRELPPPTETQLQQKITQLQSQMATNQPPVVQP